MVQVPTKPSSIVLEIANISAIIMLKQDDNDAHWEIIENESDDLAASTLSSDMEEDDVDNLPEVLQLDQTRRDMATRTTSD
jgi:hypothetical protein